jgi:hypothetical protein
MNRFRRQREERRLRTTSVTLLLLLGLLVPCVTPMLPSPTTCGMECCLTGDHCHANLAKNHRKDHDKHSSIIRIGPTANCPMRCIVLPVPTSFSIKFDRRVAHSIIVTAPIHSLRRWQAFWTSPFYASPSAPRAPPAYDGHIA